MILITLFKIYFDIGFYIIIFSPVGALIRWRLGILFSGYYGTLIANVIGSIISGALFLHRYFSRNINNEPWEFIHCLIFEGLISGFCGSLTTVSTFVKEISNLSKEGKYRDAYIYVLISITLSQIGLGIVSIIYFNLFKNNFPSLTSSIGNC